ncbi:hypothetical protein SEA_THREERNGTARJAY_71 [Mycobacterium phage ThreeRngTarjay]|nr:hypothetical protein SEA_THREERNGTARJAY_71 [Mycobacterium phage ThreeRngTarjay]
MSGELRAVLTEAIKAHKPTTKRINHPRRQEFLLNLDACMGCEWTEQDGGDHDSHVADVIASLPGVAVIQLPEPDVDEYGNTTFADGTGDVQGRLDSAASGRHWQGRLLRLGRRSAARLRRCPTRCCCCCCSRGGRP